MATHYRHPTITRRDRAIERLLELLTRLVEFLVDFWHTTEPGQHAEGATDRFADTLQDMPALAVHDQLDADTGRYRLLSDATVICGDPELTDVIPAVTDLATVDGWSLCGTLDQNGGAL